MKLLTGLLLLGTLIVAGATLGRKYFAPDALGGPATPQIEHQADPTRIDPNAIARMIPPLAPEAVPSRPPSIEEQNEEVTAPPPSVSVLDTPLPEGSAQGTERRIIESADLEAAPEVLERRIANRAKSILEQITGLPTRSMETPRDESHGPLTRNPQ